MVWSPVRAERRLQKIWRAPLIISSHCHCTSSPSRPTLQALRLGIQHRPAISSDLNLFLFLLLPGFCHSGVVMWNLAGAQHRNFQSSNGVLLETFPSKPSDLWGIITPNGNERHFPHSPLRRLIRQFGCNVVIVGSFLGKRKLRHSHCPWAGARALRSLVGGSRDESPPHRAPWAPGKLRTHSIGTEQKSTRAVVRDPLWDTSTAMSWLGESQQLRRAPAPGIVWCAAPSQRMLTVSPWVGNQENCPHIKSQNITRQQVLLGFSQYTPAQWNIRYNTPYLPWKGCRSTIAGLPCVFSSPNCCKWHQIDLCAPCRDT